MALAGYSAYQSYTYLKKVKKDGLGVLDGWTQLKEFFDHMTLNFVGALATLIALLAQVGGMMMNNMTGKTAAAMKLGGAAASGLATEALAQVSQVVSMKDSWREGGCRGLVRQPLIGNDWSEWLLLVGLGFGHSRPTVFVAVAS